MTLKDQRVGRELLKLTGMFILLTGMFILTDNLEIRMLKASMILSSTLSKGLEHQPEDLTLAGEWARSPGGRTRGELNSLTDEISNIRLDASVEDKWAWSLASNNMFKMLSKLIDEQVIQIGTNVMETLRNSLVPRKLEIFTWRVIKKRLPVRTELDKREIDLNSVRCPLCDDDLETIDHALIFCKHSMEVWNRVFGWWGLGNFTNLSSSEILRGNASTSMTTRGSLVWQAVQWVCVYYIWKNRNNMVFRGKSWNAPIALNEIQHKSFDWISHRFKGRKLD
ncbi:uncharacterized protein [Rutidosis leptorrhynchoides]|uniref:uncharacterized protein n=1 Tax=Rutidosis leptorrhynchoides TaxID=125765 RepID=UPI003A98F768